ncbi:MAG: alanine racemase [Thermodesulfovibrionales bacterium]|nr:alanine racemase [Thermodesulfovibrionales bacterium]
MNRHLKVFIDLNAIKNNLKIIRQRLTLGTGIIGVVKADAYGHGALEVAKTLENSGIEMLATAYLEEAIYLREGGIKVPILVLFEEPDPQKFLRYDLRAVIHNRKTLETLSKIMSSSSPTLSVHIKIDTGMGRLGFLPDEIPYLLKKIGDIKSIKIEGVMSHFSEAELRNKESVIQQIERFKVSKSEIEDFVKKEGQKAPIFHIANSAAIFTTNEAHFSSVRPGLSLYGYLPGELSSEELLPAMKVTTELLAIREVPSGTPISYGGTFITRRKSIIGIISAGYADGLMRNLSNKGYVIYMGKRVPIIGRICMDLTMIDLTDIIRVEEKENNEVTILGSQGMEKITAKDIASWAGTIPYEVLTTFGGLGKKEFINGDNKFVS